jgi:multicomponent Na+:H+ antiporter subunit F
MSAGLSGVTLLLLMSLGLGLLRIWRGPGFADRMLAAQLLSTTGMAILLVLAVSLDLPALHDVALILALLALLAVLAFVARVWGADDDGLGDEDRREGADPAADDRHHRRNTTDRKSDNGCA